ncbi:DUF6642 family protein [Williamsia sp. M5A3_1d]
MANRRPTGVFCLEGEWEEALESRLSMEPALQLLQDSGDIRLVHRDVATEAELRYYLERLFKNKRAGLDILYLGFHGSSQTVYLGRDEVSIGDLQEMLEGRCDGRVIHFGSCGVLRASDELLKDFCKVTKARAVLGYTRDVDWVEAAAFELLLVKRLAWSTNMKPVYDWLTATYPDLTSRLGFRMAHSKWASDRNVAVRAARDA